MAELFQAQLTDTAGKLRTASERISTLTGFKSLASAMVQRAERLEQNLFTVALFGAFSAGKSSFANALMGEMVLPVSPNPTTAAINKILPPTSAFPHGSVRVKIKSVADITADVQQSLAVFSLAAADLDAALVQIATLDAASILPNAKPHFSFLKAVAKGLESIREHLGQELLVDLKEFKSFVAKEEKACFAEWIELYYDCPLTAQGITLVDTPGADSINARHTGVAFNYIKNADAVLFVTYYNHAFSNADREFLIQLGRVKDTFEMDKMFFVVNAADLAKDEEELAGVVSHVRKNLVSCGISIPRIYPVSSQTAVLARLHEKGALKGSAEKVYRQRTGREAGDLMAAQEALVLSGITAFEKDFLSFTIQELTQIAVQSAQAEIKRAVLMLDEWIESANEDASVRTVKLQALDSAMRQAQQAIDRLETDAEQTAMAREVDELNYYVKQRLFFRYPDLFKESFNPSSLQDDGRDLKKAVRGTMEELLRFISFTLSQEMRATALRVEKYVNNSSKRIFERLGDGIRQAAPNWTQEAYQPRSFAAPEFAESLNTTPADYASALGLFKNPRDFFERNGKQALQDELEKQLQAPVTVYLERAGALLKEAYGEAFLQTVREIQQDLHTQVEEYFAGMQEALSAKVDVETLAHVRENLQQLIG